MNYHEKIETALEYTVANIQPKPDPALLSQSDRELVASPVNKFAFLNGQPDYASVNLLQTEEFYQGKVMAESVTSDSFSQLIKAYFETMGVAYDPEVGQAFFSHESQHLEIAERLGARECEIGIALHLLPNVGGTALAHSVQPITSLGNFKTTKLDCALIRAYPDKPSAEDLRDITAMGYESIEHVAERVILSKGRSVRCLPLSFDLSTASLSLRLRHRMQKV